MAWDGDNMLLRKSAHGVTTQKTQHRHLHRRENHKFLWIVIQLGIYNFCNDLILAAFVLGSGHQTHSALELPTVRQHDLITPYWILGPAGAVCVMHWNSHVTSQTPTVASYLCNRQALVGDHLLLSDFGSFGTIFRNVCVITVAMVMLSRDIGRYGIVLTTVYVY
jgi:hypothetical protein